MSVYTGKLVNISKEKPWSAPGIRTKPEECKFCRYATIGSGFCPDFYPKSPILGFLLPYPSKDDVVYQRPFSGAMGYYLNKLLIEDLGYKKEDVLIANVLRCMPPWAKGYPTGDLRTTAESNCRQYDKKHAYREKLADGGLIKYDPNLFLITYSPDKMRSIPAFQRQAVADISKAFRFAAKGYRPLVLMGDEPMELVAPWLVGKGGLKTWRGHWWEGSWPFDGSAREVITQKFKFAEASDDYQRLPRYGKGKKKN